MIDPETGRKRVTSAGKPFGYNTIYGREGDRNTPYMTRIWIGRLRLHIFHRGDADPDPHDHPWDFWTFPLTSYVEEVVHKDTAANARKGIDNWPTHEGLSRQVVPAFRLSFRSAEHTHRVLGRWTGHYVYDWIGRQRGEAPYPLSDRRKIVTIVWGGKVRRKWGFLKNRDDKWCWVAWKEYVFAGGKDGPCQ